MKRISLVILLICALAWSSFAGGILTNTNQSAQFVRMLSRNASLQLDGVYYNPAGLTKLDNGFHFALYNQSIFQEKTINSGFPWLNNGEYIGKVKAPIFPSAFAVWKKDWLALSLGIGPNAGGGSATFENGLPSFEIPLTKLVPGMAGLKALPAPYNYNVSAYNADLYFDGSSVFWGIQVGATFKINDYVSVYGGARIMPSKNTYNGYIHDIQLNVNGALVPAGTWLTGTAAPAVSGLSTAANNASASLAGTATSLQPIITLGAGSYTIAQVQAAGYISSALRAQLEGALGQLGLTPAQVAAMNMTQVQGTFTTASNTYKANATTLATTAVTLAATGSAMGDKNVETEQTGLGIAPILGANFNLGENYNLAIKYEFKAGLELTNSTKVDDLGLFPDEGKSRSDIPAILAVGFGFRPVKWLDGQISYTNYFDKQVDWGNNVRESVYKRQVKRNIDKNYWELALGLQFNITDNFAVSVGGLRSKPGVGDHYQSDFSYTNPSTTFAGGIQYKIGERLTVDAGLMNTMYSEEEVTFIDPDLLIAQPTTLGKYTETLNKTTMGFALGFSYKIF
jgi:long-chain fatty acid transport protein